MERIKVPEIIVQDIRARQGTIAQMNAEIQLVLRTYMATLDDGKIYQFNEDLTELIEVEEIIADGEGIPIEETT